MPIGAGSLEFFPNGDVTIRPLTSFFAEATLTDADRSIEQKPGYDSFDFTLAATPTNEEAQVHVDLVRKGSANNEIALTYTGYGRWEQGFTSGSISLNRRNFFVYGFETPANMLAARSGHASYSGIVRGVSTDSEGAFTEIGGASAFLVNFSAQTYSGALSLHVEAPGGNHGLGTWTFSEALARGLFLPASLHKDGVTPAHWMTDYNKISPYFYGPSGEEVAATFSILTGERGAPGTIAVGGVAIATRD